MNCQSISCLTAITITLFSCTSGQQDEQGTPAPKTQEAPAELPEVKGPAYGVDISKFQRDEIDSLVKQSDSLSFIICKATEGISYTDPDFQHNWEIIQQRGFIRGAYHFYHSQDSATPQAHHFLTAISTRVDMDLPPIIDFEEASIDKGQTSEEVQEALLDFLREIESGSGRTPILYTDINTGNKYLDRPEFARYPLWVANYRPSKEPELPEAWKKKEWLIWQRSDHYRIGQIENDFDIFNGSVDEMEAFIRGDLVTP